MKKQKFYTGELSYYFATGESRRPQFIGHNSTDDDGNVVNYKEVYDIKAGDKIRFYNKFLKNKDFLIITQESWFFLLFLSAMWNEKLASLNVDYIPAESTKSWQDYVDEYTVKNKK